MHAMMDAFSGVTEFVRMTAAQGTNAEEAKKLIDESGLKVQSAILLSEAAELVNRAVV